MERCICNQDMTSDRIFYSSNYSLWIRISLIACFVSWNLFENLDLVQVMNFGWPKEFGFGFDSISRHSNIRINLRIQNDNSIHVIWNESHVPEHNLKLNVQASAYTCWIPNPNCIFFFLTNISCFIFALLLWGTIKYVEQLYYGFSEI